MPKYRNLLPGDPAPWFYARASSRAEFAFDTVGGRYIVLCFFGTADARGKFALDTAFAEAELFNDNIASFFGVSIDPADEAQKRVVGRQPGFYFFWDFDGQISRAYGALPPDADPARDRIQLRRIWVVLDPTLRVLKVIRFADDGSDAGELVNVVRALPP